MAAGIAIGVFLFVFVVLALIFAWSSRVKKVGPNEALIISGRGEGRPGWRQRWR